MKFETLVSTERYVWRFAGWQRNIISIQIFKTSSHCFDHLRSFRCQCYRLFAWLHFSYLIRLKHVGHSINGSRAMLFTLTPENPLKETTMKALTKGLNYEKFTSVQSVGWTKFAVLRWTLVIHWIRCHESVVVQFHWVFSSRSLNFNDTII